VSVDVSDPFDAADDPALPTVALAIDGREAQRHLGRGRLSRLVGREGSASVRAIRVVRHKPGRRCVIEYDLDVDRPGVSLERVTLVGKIRFGRFGLSGYRMLSALWEAGFHSASADGISVPEPIGAVSTFRMWLQRKVTGLPVTTALAAADGVLLAARVAEAAHKIHSAGVPADARHTIVDELRILRDCLGRVGHAQPVFARRIDALVAACERLAEGVATSRPVGIHRDFYADQVIVDGARLYLLDFDLYCTGDPALDIGNFVGHITEQSLRACGRPDALADRENALADRFCELAGEELRRAVSVYTTLTLARHVYLSTLFPERRPFTATLLDLCEGRLAEVPTRASWGTRCA
jgi:hypothetical protein